jgi:hypothetical protein
MGKEESSRQKAVDEKHQKENGGQKRTVIEHHFFKDKTATPRKLGFTSEDWIPDQVRNDTIR